MVPGASELKGCAFRTISLEFLAIPDRTFAKWPSIGEERQKSQPLFQTLLKACKALFMRFSKPRPEGARPTGPWRPGAPTRRLGLLVLWIIGAMLMAGVALAQAEPPNVNAGQADDPHGVLLKPIPEKLVALTFDDGCASGYTVIAPILKSFGFGGSFYVCDFDSFRTRKDWYLTWRQMKALAEEGFEIRNHTTGHAGGAAIGSFLSMEDDLLANNVPKPTTIAWPVYQVNTRTYPDLAANGYIFGRGGHNRPYRPTVDHPFDVPSMGGGTVEEFVRNARQATGGKIVVITFHGVPDMEHPAVGLEPATFKVMMQYLKDNHYRAIALRDLAGYINPAKAARLPPTADDYKEPSRRMLVKEDKPYETTGITKPRNSAAPANKTPVSAAEEDSTRLYALTAIQSGQSNVFTWNSAAAGRWSEAAKWSNPLAAGTAPNAAGQPDYVLDFSKPGKYVVTNDLAKGFWLNQLNLSNNSVTLAGNPVVFATNPVTGTLPGIHVNMPYGDTKITVPVQLASNLAVGVADRGYGSLEGLISGPGGLIKNGPGTLKISHVTNTYTGGTLINHGKLYLFVANQGLGTGPVTLNHDANLVLEHIDGNNPLILNGGTIDADNGFGDSWNGPITLNGNTKIAAYAGFHLNRASGGMSGPGGITKIGPQGGFGRVNSGWVFLWGTNTYTGPTTIFQGTLLVKKAAALYNADMAQWSPEKISVAPAATLVISAGGPGEFTAAHAGTLLQKLTTAVNSNGLMAASVFCLDTANGSGSVVVSADITDSKGPGGGAFLLKKGGAGTLQLSGHNTYTGQTILESGTLSVSSFNRVAQGQASSRLGAPTDVENGEIGLGSGDGECALVYTGTGETTDRVLNLAGKNSTVTFDQSGSGRLKFTSTFVISGHSASKTIVLKGDTAGTGEITGAICNPHDRAGKATTAVTKSGVGAWRLSGTNSYSGPTTVTQGTLSLAHARSLGEKTDVSISEGARLDLNFQGEMRIRTLILGGKPQPVGVYSAANAPKFIKGTGVLKYQ